MGCDIHAHVEVKVKNKWLHWDELKIERDYDLFEKMAGVRGDVKNAIAPPRGLPKDINPSTKLASDIEGIDGHSHSWLSIDELLPLENITKGTWPFGYLFGNCWCGFKDTEDNSSEAAARKLGVTDARLVFWFDN